MSHHQLQGHPLGQVVPVTADNDVTACKQLPTPGQQGERVASAVATNTTTSMSTAANVRPCRVNRQYSLSTSVSVSDF